MKNNQIFLFENSQFLVVKFLVYSNRDVFVMACQHFICGEIDETYEACTSRQVQSDIIFKILGSQKD